MKHLILTRWNIRNMVLSPIVSKAWFERRREIFIRYCVPSIAQQTAEDFEWIIMIDSETSVEEMDWLIRQDERITLAPISDPESAGSSLAVQLARSADGTVITTRLDSDDALHRDHIRRLQDIAIINEGKRYFVEFTRGAVFDVATDALFRVRFESNAFVSMIEPAQDPMTVYCTGHMGIRDVAPVVSVEETGWLITIHGENQISGLNSFGPREEVGGFEKIGLLESFGLESFD